MPTPAQVIQYAALAEVYAANAVANGNLFSPYTDPRLPLMINMERKALAWKYSYDPTNTTDLVAVANYVWAICGKFGLMAQSTITQGGGSVTPGTPTIIQSPIRITGAEFTSALSWTGSNSYGVNVLAAYDLQVFWNTYNRFLDEGISWSRTSTGFDIIIDGTVVTSFDATTTNIDDVFYIYISA
jgi:hypothetical protein